LEDNITKHIPSRIKLLEERISGYIADISQRDVNTPDESIPKEDRFRMTVNGVLHTEKAEAGKAILSACQQMKEGDMVHIGGYMGFRMLLSFDAFSREFRVDLKSTLSHTVSLGMDAIGNITRMDNQFGSFDGKLVKSRDELEAARQQMENVKSELGKPFQFEQEMKDKTTRLAKLDIQLNMDQKSDVQILDEGQDVENTGTPSLCEKGELDR
jgi:hypothetical protein